MAIAFVRSIAASANFVSTVTPVLSSVAAGNKLVLGLAVWQDFGNTSVPNSVSSSPAATWRNDINGGMAFSGPGQGQQTSLWSADVVTGGTQTVTASFSGGVYGHAVLAEYSGLAAGASSFDKSAAAQGSDLTTSPSNVGPTAALAQNDELVVAVFGASGVIGSSNIALVTPSGYTNRFRENDAYTISAISYDDRIVAAGGTQSASWAHGTTDTGWWSALIGTYKMASGAGASAGQTKTLTLPAQAATAALTAKAASSQAIALPTQTATATRLGVSTPTTTWDSTTVTWDSTVVTWDGGVPSVSTFTQAATLAAPAQAATARITAQASAAQALGLPTPTQTATGFFGVATNQLLPPPAQTLTVVSSMEARHVRPMTMPGQDARAIRLAIVQANQTLPPPTQITSDTPVFHLTQGATLLMVDQRAAVRLVPFPPPPVELMPETTGIVPGSVEDMVQRQIQVLPPWFGPPGIVPPMLRIPLAMAGSVSSWLWEFIQYARQQMRITTATDGFLDLIAYDFFRDRIRRRSGQGDDSFRARIKTEMFRPRATRPAMAAVLRDLTGNEPRIFEPNRPADVGGIGLPGGLAVGVSGAVGSIGTPGEVFIDVFRSPDAGIPFAAGIGASVGGIGVSSRLVVASLEEVVGSLRDEDVYTAVEATRPVGIVTWVRIQLGQRPAA